MKLLQIWRELVIYYLNLRIDCVESEKGEDLYGVIVESQALKDNIRYRYIYHIYKLSYLEIYNKIVFNMWT